MKVNGSSLIRGVVAAVLAVTLAFISSAAINVGVTSHALTAANAAQSFGQKPAG